LECGEVSSNGELASGVMAGEWGLHRRRNLMPERSKDRTVFCLYIVMLLAYIGVSYLLICAYIAPPFTLIGEVERANDYVGDTIAGALIALFLLLAVMARIRWRSQTRMRRVLGMGFLILLAGILGAVVYEFGVAWTAADMSVKKTAACNGTGMLGIGWALLSYLTWKTFLTRSKTYAESPRRFGQQTSEDSTRDGSPDGCTK